MQRRLRVELLEASGDSTAVHYEACGRYAEGGDSVGCIRGCVGGYSGGGLVLR